MFCYFGLRVFGGIYGLVFCVSNVGVGLGFFIMGGIYDVIGFYVVV